MADPVTKLRLLQQLKLADMLKQVNFGALKTHGFPQYVAGGRLWCVVASVFSRLSRCFEVTQPKLLFVVVNACVWIVWLRTVPCVKNYLRFACTVVVHAVSGADSVFGRTSLA